MLFPQRLLKLCAYLLICRAIVGVLWSYVDYMPPDFGADFLLGREAYFWGSYSWAFYVHIVSGPVSLVFGMILVSYRFRHRYPIGHRFVGRAQVFCVLGFVVPSGLAMSFYAQTGFAAGIGFAVLALLTGVCVACGWRATLRRRFDEHQRWMLRCFVLLCSAVVLRVIGGLATVASADVPWLYPLSAWVSWVGPLAVLEGVSVARKRGRKGLRVEGV